MPRMNAPLLAIFGFLAVSPGAWAATPTYVHPLGDDSAVAYSCSFQYPCKTIGAAISVTDSSGHVIVLGTDSHPPFTVDKSLSIVAPPGVSAIVKVPSGTGINISPDGSRVVLRGLTIKANGGITGIAMGAGELALEQCIISNFSGNGIQVTGDSVVSIHKTKINANYHGIQISGGSKFVARQSQFLDNSARGISFTSTNNASLDLEDVVITGGTYGVYVDHNGATAWVKSGFTVNRTTIVGSSNDGIYAHQQGNGPVVGVIKDSMLVGHSSNGVQLNSATKGPQVVVLASVLSDNNIGAYANAAPSEHSRLQLRDSLLSGNSFSGIYAYRGWVAAENSVFNANTYGVASDDWVYARNNLISDNLSGAAFWSGGLLSGNTITRNTNYGVYFGSPSLTVNSDGSNTVRDNLISDLNDTLTPISPM